MTDTTGGTQALPRRASSAFAGLALAACLTGCGSSAPDGPNLLIVSFDTLRADRLGSYGNDEWSSSPSPHADALASRGVVFDQCRATRGQTHPSVASMLTGKFPITTGVRENVHTLGTEHTTLMQMLQGAGYQTGVFVANFQREWPADNWVYRGADVSADGFQGNRGAESRMESMFQQRWDERVERATLEFLDGRSAEQPFAAWVHFYDIHKPYNPPDGYANLDTSAPLQPKVLAAPGPRSAHNLESHLGAITLGARDVPDAELRAVRGLYDATVKATDARLGRILEKLRERGLDDDTIIVFTADHGEELYDRNRYFYHGASIYDGTVRVPLVISGPGIDPRRVTSHVQNVDLAPTVLDLLGLDVPTDMEGASLGGLIDGSASASPRPYSFVEWQDLIYAVSDGRWLYIDNRFHVHPRKSPYNSAPPSAPQGFAMRCFEAYDLSVDPGQQHDLLVHLDPATLDDDANLPAPIASLRQALEAWKREPQHQKAMELGVSDEELERMTQLGYVGPSTDRQDVYFAEPCAPR